MNEWMKPHDPPPWTMSLGTMSLGTMSQERPWLKSFGAATLLALLGLLLNRIRRPVAGCQCQSIGWETGNRGDDGSRRLCRKRQVAAEERKGRQCEARGGNRGGRCRSEWRPGQCLDGGGHPDTGPHPKKSHPALQESPLSPLLKPCLFLSWRPWWLRVWRPIRRVSLKSGSNRRKSRCPMRTSPCSFWSPAR